MTFDLVFGNARIAGAEDRMVDIGIHSGRFAAIEAKLPEADGPTQDLAGRLVTPGLVETHIHLDKSCLLGRCNCEQGTLDEAIAEVASAKKKFTEEDVYARARNTLEKSAEARNHPDANACGSGPTRRTNQFSRAAAAEEGLRLGHRSRIMRLSAGGPAR